MVEFIKAIGRMENSMEEDCIEEQMDEKEKVNGKKVKKSDGLMNDCKYA